jgi:hypothetical protein
MLRMWWGEKVGIGKLMEMGVRRLQILELQHGDSDSDRGVSLKFGMRFDWLVMSRSRKPDHVLV